MTRCLTIALLALAASLAGTTQAAAQTPPAKPLTGEASAGLALTNGNKDTSTGNAAYDLVYDPHTRNIVKSDGLFIHGSTEHTTSANRLGLNAHDEYRLTDGLFVFGQNQYLKDEFKNIDYLLAPTGGLGYQVIDMPRAKLTADAGVGGVWEKNPGLPVKKAGAVTADEKFKGSLTATTTVTQSVSALWKTDDFSDSLYTAGIALAASISTRTQLKVELLDTFKNRPPAAGILKNDVAVLMAIVFKM